jgi:hypothetical protein
MALLLSLQLVSKAAIALLPIIITFSLIINSFMNGDSKALFFIFGTILLYGLNYLFIDYLPRNLYADLSNSTGVIDENFITGLFKLPSYLRKSPSFAVTFMSFVLLYVCLPLKDLPRDSEFPLLMVFTLVFLTISALINSFIDMTGTEQRIKIGGNVLASLLGMGWGAAWWAIVKGKKDSPSGHTYFSANSSDSVKCSRPSTQAFKCTVYKDGKPVGDINT